MVRHFPGLRQRPVAFQVVRDAGCPRGFEWRCIILSVIIRCGVPVERPVVRNSGPSFSPAMPAVAMPPARYASLAALASLPPLAKAPILPLCDYAR